VTKKSGIRKATEWLKRFKPEEIKEVADFTDNFKKQLREKPEPSGAQYTWSTQQHLDLLALRESWLDLSKRFDAADQAERDMAQKLIYAGAIGALNAVAETLMDLIDNHSA
jgi:hypothetical protein